MADDNAGGLDASGDRPNAIWEYLARAACDAKLDAPGDVEIAKIIDELSSHSSRVDMAMRLANALIPAEPNLKIWASWLSGGDTPPKFSPPKLPPGRRSTASMGKSLKAVARHVGTSARAIEEMEREAERLRMEAAELRAASEKDSEFARAFLIRSLLHEMGKANADIFAMGPTWVLMDAVSRHPASRNMMEDLRDCLGDDEVTEDLGNAIASVLAKFSDRIKARRLAEAGMTAEERDAMTADYIRGRLSSLAAPVVEVPDPEDDGGDIIYDNDGNPFRDPFS